jgi:hypothetical protein
VDRSRQLDGIVIAAGKRVEIIGPERGDPYYEQVACGAQSEG